MSNNQGDIPDDITKDFIISMHGNDIEFIRVNTRTIKVLPIPPNSNLTETITLQSWYVRGVDHLVKFAKSQKTNRVYWKYGSTKITT
jgi:hypothetical protein